MRALKRAVWNATGTLGKHLKRWTVPILTYHSIDDTGSVVSTSPEAFRWQMEYLADEGFRSLSLREYVARLTGGDVPRERAVVITFDDAFRNVREVAGPVLRKAGFTATVFVPTDHAGGLPVWDMKEGLPRLPLMDWSELAELRDGGFELHSHSRSHPHLSTLSPAGIRAEIDGSLRALEERLGCRTDVFCYPYGDHDDRVIEALVEAGFLGAVTIRFGSNHAGADPFRLKRIGSAYFKDPAAFRASIWGLYAPLLDLRKRVLGRA